MFYVEHEAVGRWKCLVSHARLLLDSCFNYALHVFRGYLEMNELLV